MRTTSPDNLEKWIGGILIAVLGICAIFLAIDSTEPKPETVIMEIEKEWSISWEDDAVDYWEIAFGDSSRPPEPWRTDMKVDRPAEPGDAVVVECADTPVGCSWLGMVHLRAVIDTGDEIFPSEIVSKERVPK